MLRICIFFLPLIYSFTFGDAIVQCEQRNVTIELPSSSPTTYSISTWFCWKQGIQLHANRVVHITAHGFSYDHTYWSFPYQSPSYSYVDYVINNSNGRIVVLNIDRLGVGLSSKPPLATDVTVDSNANAIYQLTKKLHDGEFQNVRFRKIILVGHSLGTVIGWRLASNRNYNRYLDGLIATGYLHLLNPVGLAAFLAALYPVQLDPKFSQQSFPQGYLTTNPSGNVRQVLFYNTNDVDPNIINLDEKMKQTGTISEISTIPETSSPNVTRMIPKKIPVLVVIGQYDFVFCDPLNITFSCDQSTILQQREQPSYSSTIDTYVLSQSGHNINLHLNAQDWYQKAITWTEEHF